MFGHPCPATNLLLVLALVPAAASNVTIYFHVDIQTTAIICLPAWASTQPVMVVLPWAWPFQLPLQVKVSPFLRYLGSYNAHIPFFRQQPGGALLYCHK